MADRHKNTKQAKRREKQEAAQRFLEDRLGRLETVREMVNAELDRRKDEFSARPEAAPKDLRQKCSRWKRRLQGLWPWRTAGGGKGQGKRADEEKSLPH
ncbi:protein regulator of cytokinesis 1 [Alloprevotella tannerae]|uniref:protein regulator of cytokinesis 1 n=1 Tax=Alloprevotella tannerae TaxID=76122 RepID=UPI00241CA5EA|nr:protein regulator of cytokinesis 1 [Alloprevotella tannerae]